MRSSNGMKSEGGFSLVEILIGCAILGILLTLAVSTFTGLREKYRVEAATKQLYADLMDARARAVQRSRVCFVRFGATGYTTIEDVSPQPDGNGMLDNGVDTVCAQVNGTNAIDLSQFGGANAFQFDRSGLASRTGTLRILSTAQADYDCLTIGPTRINMGSFSGGVCVEK